MRIWMSASPKPSLEPLVRQGRQDVRQPCREIRLARQVEMLVQRGQGGDLERDRLAISTAPRIGDLCPQHLFEIPGDLSQPDRHEANARLSKSGRPSSPPIRSDTLATFVSREHADAEIAP